MKYVTSPPPTLSQIMVFCAALIATGFVNYVYYLFLPDTFNQAESLFQFITSLMGLLLMVYGLYVIRESQALTREKAELRTVLGGLLSSSGLALYLILILG